MLDPPRVEGIRQLLILSILKWIKNKTVNSQDGSKYYKSHCKSKEGKEEAVGEICRHSRGLDLHIQWRGSQMFQSTQLFLGQPTQHAGQPYAGGATVTLILLSPEQWVSSLLKADHSA